MRVVFPTRLLVVFPLAGRPHGDNTNNGLGNKEYYHFAPYTAIQCQPQDKRSVRDSMYIHALKVAHSNRDKTTMLKQTILTNPQMFLMLLKHSLNSLWVPRNILHLDTLSISPDIVFHF